MNCSMPGLPINHQLPEFTQTHVHRVGDAIQPSHPLPSPFPPAPNPSQHQSLFQWVNSSHEVAKVLEFQLQHHSFQRIPRADLLQNGLVGSPCSPRDSQESSPTPQFKSINYSVLSFLHSPTLTSILSLIITLPHVAFFHLHIPAHTDPRFKRPSCSSSQQAPAPTSCLFVEEDNFSDGARK